jgi:hypothetical protein
MARNTEIIEGKHLIKATSYDGRTMVAVPKKLAAEVGINGDGFVGAMVVGNCVVLAQVSRINPEEFEAEMNGIFDRAIEEWKK